MDVVIIGLGGVGSILAGRLCRFLNYSREIKSPHIILVDGDDYEYKNYERQEFGRIGNKAKIQSAELSMQSEKVTFEPIPEYVNNTNISNIIKNNYIVFLCVDNHKTRKLTSDYCRTLENVILISGGNELTDGNAQLYVRKGGKDLTPDLCAYHPEIANPDDKLPEEMSCEELSQSEPQLYFTNLGVATFMCWFFYNTVIKGNVNQSEVYFDILSMTADAKTRIVK